VGLKVEDVEARRVPQALPGTRRHHSGKSVVPTPGRFPDVEIRGADGAHTVRCELIDPGATPAIALIACLYRRHPGGQLLRPLLARHRTLSAGDICAVTRDPEQYLLAVAR